MLVVADLDGEPYLPCPDDLLVSLSESRSVIEAFLERLGDMFRPTQNPANCLGRALQFSFKLLVRRVPALIVLLSKPSIARYWWKDCRTAVCTAKQP